VAAGARRFWRALAVLGKVEAEDGAVMTARRGIEAGPAGERRCLRGGGVRCARLSAGEEQDAACVTVGSGRGRARSPRRLRPCRGREGFATPWLAADDAGRLGGPQSIDQPAAAPRARRRARGRDGRAKARSSPGTRSVRVLDRGRGLGAQSLGGAKIFPETVSHRVAWLLSQHRGPGDRRHAAQDAG